MAPLMRYSDARHDFEKWKVSSETRSPGRGGIGLEANVPFISESRLTEYLKTPNQVERLLDDVLDSSQRADVVPGYIRGHYRKTFAILLSIGRGDLIHHFQQYESLKDHNLPHRSKPSDFPLQEQDIFESFQKAQWQFCPTKFYRDMNNARFDLEEVLPIVRKEILNPKITGSAKVYKIVIDGDYNHLQPEGPKTSTNQATDQNTFVLKSFSADEVETYNAERKAYSKLKWDGRPSPNIITCFGSFVHGDSYHLILEYADLGTLEDFMKKDDRPLDVEGVLLLWDRLFDAVQGLMHIHGQDKGDLGDCSASQMFRPRQELKGFHQDLKPTNIVVFQGASSSPFDCHFKIADLGLAHFSSSSSDKDVFGTRDYGAPETLRNNEGAESVPIQITQAVDMWSIGCIFSEFAVWIHHGWPRLSEYRRQRSQEIFQNGGEEGERHFYHNDKLLQAVESAHQDIVEKETVVHQITRLVLEKHVCDLLQCGERPNAKLLHEQCKRLVDKKAKYFGVNLKRLTIQTDLPSSSLSTPKRTSKVQPPSPSTVTSTSVLGPRTSELLEPNHALNNGETRGRSETEALSNNLDQNHFQDPNETIDDQTQIGPSFKAPLPHDGSKPQLPFLSLKEGLDWKSRQKAHGSSDLAGSQNLHYLGERDHVFIIDNSASMRKHTRDVSSLFSLLSYLVKKSDRDGIDLLFTQTSTRKHSSKTSDLAAAINRERFFDQSDMRTTLHNEFKLHTHKFGTMIQPPKSFLGFGTQPAPYPQPALSFYVFTDAKWVGEDVGALIQNVVRKMLDKGCDKEHVAIQFIRFGDDPESIKTLDRLDQGLGLQDIGMDIVDHTYWDENVWKHLLGPIIPGYDDDKKQQLSHRPLQNGHA